MINIVLMVIAFVAVALSLMPHDMLQDFWNMLWKKDSPYD